MTSSAADQRDGAADRPRLATPAQQDAELTLLRLLGDPELRRVKTAIRDGLAATPRGRTASGAATLDRAVDLWTNSLTLAEISVHQPVPAFTWGTDNTPRTWLGHTLPGIGTSGDNPDAYYRLAVIDGTRRYEVSGRFDPARRPAQVTLELHKGAKVNPPPLNGDFSDLMPLASITDRALDVAPDGTFRFTVGPEPHSPVHMTSKPGVLTLGIRDMLADWSQLPCELELRPLDAAEPRHPTDADILQATYKDLPPYIDFWAKFPDVWFGGLTGNTISPGHTRTGSLAGFTVAISFDLAPDEAVVVTMDPADAAYTGFQVMDPWMISADSTRHQVSLNNTQSTPHQDGTVTYVISAADPGVANWLSTAGQHSGLALMRWQAVPDAGDIDPATLARDFRVVKLTDLPELPHVTPEQRAAQMAARIAGYRIRAS